RLVHPGSPVGSRPAWRGRHPRHVHAWPHGLPPARVHAMASEAADTIALEIEPDVDVQPRTPAVAAGFFDADAGAASEPHVLARDPVHVREHGAPGETASGDV